MSHINCNHQTTMYKNNLLCSKVQKCLKKTLMVVHVNCCRVLRIGNLWLNKQLGYFLKSKLVANNKAFLVDFLASPNSYIRFFCFHLHLYMVRNVMWSQNLDIMHHRYNKLYKNIILEAEWLQKCRVIFIVPSKCDYIE